MPKSVRAIPATVNLFNSTPITNNKKRRVAAYARVSTDQEEQLTSYEAQVDYYTNYIKSRSDWEFVDVYTDEGIIPVEVKAGKSTQAKSLSVYSNLYNPKYAIRISTKDFGYNPKTKIKSVPLYAVFLI